MGHEHVVSDSSTLILLAKAEIIQNLLENKKVYVTKTVKEEAIKRGKEKGKKDAFQLEKLEKKGKIQVKDPTEKKKKKISKLFSLHKGEKEALALASQLSLPLICDDKKAFNACKVMGIPHATALNILTALYKKDRISKKKAKKSLNKLERFGWYKKELINNTKEEVS